jgi:8-oxo-dGTP diphosphatase
LAAFKDKKVLMVRDNKNDTVFYNVGGKIEEGESAEQCLVREVKEEIECDIKPDTIHPLKVFQDVAHNKENTLVNIKLYAAEIVGLPTPDNEVVEVRYFDSTIDPSHLSPIGKQIFTWLKAYKYIH